MSERVQREKLLAVSLTVVLLASALVGVVALSGTAAAAGNSETTPSRIEVVDVGQSSGDLTVTVQGTSSKHVTDLNFTYRDLTGGSTLGPLEYSNASAFVGATYDNRTAYEVGDPVHQGAGNTGKVTFRFDSSKNGFEYVQHAFRVNVTGYDTKYKNADTGNRSIITANHYQVSGVDHTGSPLGGVPIMFYEAGTNESGGFAFLSGSSKGFHCQGFDKSGTCTNPDTDTAGTVVPAGQSPASSAAPVTFQTFALSQSNASKKVDPGSRGSVSLTADKPRAPVFVNWGSSLRNNPLPDVENITVVAADTDNVVYRDSGVSRETMVPVFLRPNTRYVVSLENGGTFGTYNRTLVYPAKGTSGASLKIPTGSVDRSTVAGQVVDESGNPVADAVVVAQPKRTTGSQLEVYNSTSTDSNGLFSMKVPETDQLQQDMGFRIVGTDTSGGTPVYYPTTDTNDGEGYTIQSGKTVLPPMVLQKGGRINVDVTSKKTKLPVSTVFTSLSQVSSAFPQLTRTANANTFTTLAFGRQTPKSASVELLAPTTGSDTQVTYNVWGLGQSIGKYLCANNVDVSQGQDTASTCSLSNGGYIDLRVDEYRSIVQQGTSRQASLGDFGFFFENELVVRKASNGEVVTYLGPDGAQQSFVERTGPETNVSIPVPAGDYELELRPRGEFGQWTTVNDTAKVTVTSGNHETVTLDRGRSFEVRPVFERFERSLKRDGENTLAVQVADPATGNLLTDSELTVTAQLLEPDGTTAMTPVTLSYNSTDGSFDTKTFKPKAQGVDAGTYDIAVTASHAAGTRTYNTTVRAPTQVTGIRTYMDFSSRTVAPGSRLLGLVKAYDGGSGVSASASDVDITVYDRNGKQVSTTNPDNGITSGEGSFSVSMPDEPGRYRVTTKIDTGTKQGIAQRTVRVSQVDLEVETNKRTYSPTDTVTVNVEASDATDGSAIEDATVELQVNGTRNITATDANGESTIRLDPSTYAQGESWNRGHPITVTLIQETDTGVVRKTTGTGFEIRAFEARAAPASRSFTPSEAAKMDVFVPTDKTISSVTVTELDGEQVSIGGSAVTNPASGLYRVDLGQLPVGDHIVTATVKTGSGATQTATTQVPVKSYDISASLNKRSFETGETIDLTVGVRKPDGTAVSGQSVDVSLNASGPGQVDSGTQTTGTSGEASFSLSSSSGGGHFLKVTVGQQERYLGLFVSDVSVRLEDSSGNAVEGYEAEPGTTKTLYVDATKAGGGAVPDGSNVTAFVDAFDRRVELGSATTTNGEASISFDVPASIPAREYGLAVGVTTTEGTGTAAGVLNVTGANAKQVSASTNESAYTPGSAARLSATVTTGDGAPIANEDVDFVLQSEGSAENRIATVSTNADGVATYDYAIPSDANGEYVLKTALNDTASIRAYSGFRVRDFDVSITAEDGPFAPGDSVSLTVFANDSNGDAVSVTGGSLSLVLPGSNAEKTLSLSGSSPYDVSVTVPDDSSVTGTRPVSVTLQKDRTSDTDSTLVEVRDDSESANLSIAGPVTAGQATTVTVNGTVDTTATLTAFSPNAETVAFNDSVSVSSSSDTDKSMTIGSPGTYIVKLSVPSVGTLTEVIEVQPASGEQTVWTGTSVSANATAFSTSEDIYVKTNEQGMTATVISRNATYEIELDQQSGDTYYGILSTDRPADVYLVRLDSAKATSVDDTLVEVSD